MEYEVYGIENGEKAGGSFISKTIMRGVIHKPDTHSEETLTKKTNLLMELRTKGKSSDEKVGQLNEQIYSQTNNCMNEDDVVIQLNDNRNHDDNNYETITTFGDMF